ncbi:MAG: hypothetical protein WA813_15235, partial [Beijerinckiaceae bacterium]
ALSSRVLERCFAGVLWEGRGCEGERKPRGTTPKASSFCHATAIEKQRLKRHTKAIVDLGPPKRKESGAVPSSEK